MFVGYGAEVGRQEVAAVVREDATYRDTEVGKVRDRTAQEGRRRGATLVGKDLDVEVPAVVINRDIVRLPCSLSFPGVPDMRERLLSTCDR